MVVPREDVLLEDVLKRMLHGFTKAVSKRGKRNVLGVDRYHLTLSPTGCKSAEAASQAGEDFYQNVFRDNCSRLTLQFLYAVVPFLQSHGRATVRLPRGDVVPLSDITSYRGNYVDPSVPMHGRISHDVLGVSGTLFDISGAQFRGAEHPVVCWFDSPEALHASFQGRPLQSFRELRREDMTLTLPSFDEEVKEELLKMIRRDEEDAGICGWCYGAGSRKCASCKVAVYCGRACQRSHWTTGGHRAACAARPEPPGSTAE
mmetsp:Transcript_8122/g.20510  ORF Transcript_8122/g.20510 Transcript_8122/m.20510 type:complete len:260 (+) Transcript_8122:199-978(+)